VLIEFIHMLPRLSQLLTEPLHPARISIEIETPMGEYILFHFMLLDVHGLRCCSTSSERVLPGAEVSDVTQINARPEDTHSARNPRDFGAPVSPSPIIDEDTDNDRTMTGDRQALFTGRATVCMVDE
jgi:hypothetical protein